MGVGVQGNAYGGMAQPFLDDLGVDSLGQPAPAPAPTPQPVTVNPPSESPEALALSWFARSKVSPQWVQWWVKKQTGVSLSRERCEALAHECRGVFTQ